MQRSFIRLKRVNSLIQTYFDEETMQKLSMAIQRSFSTFKQYCAIALDLRMQETLA
jgi:hypothetical protein